MANFERDWTTEVHEHVSEMLEVLELSASEFAIKAGLSTEVVEAILSGCEIDDHMADGLEAATGLGAVVWLNIQASHKAFKARRATGCIQT